MIRHSTEEFMSIQKPSPRRYGFFIFGCALLALSATTSAIEVVPRGADMTVPYSDLDLNTVEGASILLKRINDAAAGVCDPINQGTSASLRAKKKRDACVLQLTSEAVARVNRPLLLAAHESALKKSKAKVAMPG
jgi:UrcA family protein